MPSIGRQRGDSGDGDGDAVRLRGVVARRVGFAQLRRRTDGRALDAASPHTPPLRESQRRSNCLRMATRPPAGKRRPKANEPPGMRSVKPRGRFIVRGGLAESALFIGRTLGRFIRRWPRSRRANVPYEPAATFKARASEMIEQIYLGASASAASIVRDAAARRRSRGARLANIRETHRDGRRRIITRIDGDCGAAVKRLHECRRLRGRLCAVAAEWPAVRVA